MSFRFYVAGRFGRRDELRGYAEELQRRFGWECCARWLFDEPQFEDTGTHMPAESARIKQAAREDLTDVMQCDLFLAFSEEPDSPYGRGGRHVELGMMFARWFDGQDCSVHIIGPHENLFHYHSLVAVFPTWQGYLERIRRNPAGKRQTEPPSA